MKRKELHRRLNKLGYKVHNNNPHDKAIHPSNPKNAIPIPHGSEIDEYLAKSILKRAKEEAP